MRLAAKCIISCNYRHFHNNVVNVWSGLVYSRTTHSECCSPPHRSPGPDGGSITQEWESKGMKERVKRKRKAEEIERVGFSELPRLLSAAALDLLNLRFSEREHLPRRHALKGLIPHVFHSAPRPVSAACAEQYITLWMYNTNFDALPTIPHINDTYEATIKAIRCDSPMSHAIKCNCLLFDLTQHYWTQYDAAQKRCNSIWRKKKFIGVNLTYKIIGQNSLFTFLNNKGIGSLLIILY